MIATDADTIRALAACDGPTRSQTIARLRGIGLRRTQRSLARLRDAGLVGQLGDGSETRWRLACSESAAMLALRVELAGRVEALMGGHG